MGLLLRLLQLANSAPRAQACFLVNVRTHINHSVQKYTVVKLHATC